ncbi:SDR family NAD(P)-dependent oxidoreductase [Pedobacter metabolipauper]|uniref:Short subunit dehydrogenase n=1 Tax=Pedobacter metabolipauper TaxID=425513 RepID=A0A4R6SYL3_9SPHI|nr:SDR family NAD(P)-dependent oxidoreductase [Pedobacter metabolipauper]TDQ11526.1 short subunit dehydrogenase [Pedobacter metabolipauper]
MKNIVLTGTSSGFGLMTAQTLAKAGHQVYATMRNIHTSNAGAAQKLLQWADEHAVFVKIIELDVTSEESAVQAIDKIASDCNNQIDVLINNAGMGFIGLSETLSAAQTNQLFQINVIGADRMIKAVLPYFHKRKQGLIISLSSVTARQPVVTMGVYSATKSAIDTLSAVYHYELRSSGIDVSIVQAGAYPATDILTKQLVPAHPEMLSLYSEGIQEYQKRVLGAFIPKEEHADPQEVADLISTLVVQERKDRKLWNLINGGPFTVQIEEGNASIKNMIESMLNYSGISY